MVAVKVSSEILVEKFLRYLQEIGSSLKFNDKQWLYQSKGSTFEDITNDDLEHMVRTWLFEARVSQTVSLINNLMKLLRVRLKPFDF